MISNNLIIAKGTAQQITIDTEEVEKEGQKIIRNITLPKNATKILDLLRVEFRYIVTGLITKSEDSTIWELFNSKGVFLCDYDGEEFYANFEKLNVTNSNRIESEVLEVKFTLIRGVNLQSGS